MDPNLSWPRAAVAIAVIAGLTISIVALAWVVISLSSTDQESFGHWIAAHYTSILAFLVGVAPSVATFFIGRVQGVKSGKTQAFSGAAMQAIAANQPTLATTIVADAANQGIRVTL